MLPPKFEPMREKIEATVTPLENPRATTGVIHRLRPAAGEPEGALVLMHGRATDENDLFGLLDLLDPERRLLGVTPAAR